MVFASGFGIFFFFLLDLREFMILFVTNMSRTSLLNNKRYHQRWRYMLYAAHTVDTVNTVDMVYTVGMIYSVDMVNTVNMVYT